MPKMMVIGLTGGIASGKSTVSHELIKLGVPVIDADKVAWQLAEPRQPIWQAYYERYGAAVINEDMSLNRQAVADRVFSEPKELEWMNSMAHPIIRQTMAQQLDKLEKEGTQLVVLDVPLLLETGWQSMVDQVWVVYVTYSAQLQRLMARNKMSEAEAKKRIAAQMSMEAKKGLADVVIDNNGTRRQLLEQVHCLVNNFKV